MELVTGHERHVDHQSHGAFVRNRRDIGSRVEVRNWLALERPNAELDAGLVHPDVYIRKAA